MAVSLSKRDLARELAGYGVPLSSTALGQLSNYLELLLRWNQRINLTGLREPRQIIRKLFGESLYLASRIELQGWLVDVGTGAGFPGLALKLAAPELRATLIESRQKKCAFLKEVIRQCGFSMVDVVGERFETWAHPATQQEKPALYATRAVNVQKKLLDLMRATLAPTGRAVFLTSSDLVGKIQDQATGWTWERIIPIPETKYRVILVGQPRYLIGNFMKISKLDNKDSSLF